MPLLNTMSVHLRFYATPQRTKIGKLVAEVKFKPEDVLEQVVEATFRKQKKQGMPTGKWYPVRNTAGTRVLATWLLCDHQLCLCLRLYDCATVTVTVPAPTGAVVGELRFAVAIVDTDIRRMVNGMPVLMDLSQGTMQCSAYSNTIQ